MDFSAFFNSNHVSTAVLFLILVLGAYLLRRKLKAFGYVFARSLTSPAYYKDVINADFRLSIKYFVSLVLLSSVIVSFFVTVRSVDEVMGGFNSLLNRAETIFPEDLVIKIEEGKMSINKPQPYFVPLPEVDGAEESKQVLPGEVIENLVVFDSQGTLDDLSEYKTLALVNENNVLVRESNRTQVYPLRDMPDTDFTRQEYNEFLGLLKPLAAYVPYIFFMLVLLGILFYYFTIRVAVLFIVTFVLFIAGRLGGVQLKYQQFFMVAAHSVTLPVLIEVVTNSVGVAVWLPFWFFVLHLVYGLFIIFKLKETKAAD